MLIVVEHGRLGNQLFQVAEVISIKRQREKVVLIGDWEECLQILPIRDVLHIPLSRTWRLYITTRTVGRWLRNLRWFFHVHDDTTVSPNVRFRIVLITGYFQKFLEPHQNLTAQLKSSSSKFQDLNESRHFDTPYLICHVRRADYASWPSVECPAILSGNWYRVACEEYRRINQIETKFLIISDDHEFGLSLANTIANAEYQTTQSAGEVIQIIARSNGGVISPSSIAWWGAYYGYLSSTKRRFFAPYYWAGHHCHRWHPTNQIQAPFLDFQTFTLE